MVLNISDQRKITISGFNIGIFLLTIAIVFSPILLLYKVVLTINYFDVLSFASILLIVISALLKKNSHILTDNLYLKLVPFVVSVLFSFTISLAFSGFDLDSCLRTLRFLYYLILVIVFSKFFNKSYGLKIFKYSCIVCTAFICIQFLVLKLFGFYISGFVDFLPMIDDSLKTVVQGKDPNIIRPRSFFQEPAHYGAYVVTYLFLDFIYNKRNKYSIIIDVFLLVGIIIASANTGMFMAAFSLLAYLIKLIKNINNDNNKKILLVYSIFIALGIIVLIVLFFTGHLDKQINQIFGGNSFLGRFANYSHIFDFSTQGKGIVSILFGRGMVKSEAYFAGYARILFYFGLTGLATFSYSLLTNKKGLPFILFIMVLNLGTETFFGSTNVLLFSLYLVIVENGTMYFPYSKKGSCLVIVQI